MRDPYQVLGVKKSDDEKAIKSAFRKMAKKYHPDQNQGDDSAQAKFSEVNQAYEIVGDKAKRKQFDAGEIDGEGKPKFASFQGGNPFGEGGNPFGGGGGSSPFGNRQGFSGGEDIFSELFGSAFGGNTQTRGRSSADSFFNQQRQEPAPATDLEMKAGVTIDDLMRGKTNIRMPDGKTLSLSIPAEAEDGQVVRLKGKGKQMPGRTPGDAKVTLKMKTDAIYQRFGTDLRRDFPLPLETAVMGGKVVVDTMDGKISLKIPAGTNSGTLFRLKGKGLPKKAGGQGDLIVSTAIQLEKQDVEKLTDYYEAIRNKTLP